MVGKRERIGVAGTVGIASLLTAVLLLGGGCNKLLPGYAPTTAGPGQDWVTPVRPSKDKRKKAPSLFFDQRSHDIEDSLGL